MSAPAPPSLLLLSLLFFSSAALLHDLLNNNLDTGVLFVNAAPLRQRVALEHAATADTDTNTAAGTNPDTAKTTTITTSSASATATATDTDTDTSSTVVAAAEDEPLRADQELDPEKKVESDPESDQAAAAEQQHQRKEPSEAEEIQKLFPGTMDLDLLRSYAEDLSKPVKIRSHPSLSGSSAPVDVSVPQIIYGTAWKNDKTDSYVSDAAVAGYRAFDTANQPRHYNEARVGIALSGLFQSPSFDPNAPVRDAALPVTFDRSEIFIQSKFTPIMGQDKDPATLPYSADATIAEQVHQSLTSSLLHLGTEYLDSYILHEPYPDHAQTMEAWRAMEKAHAKGLVRLLGISNANVNQLKLLLQDASIPPTFIQNRVSAKSSWDSETRAFALSHSIHYQGFSLLSSNRFVLLEPSVKSFATWHGVSPAQIVHRFALQSGILILSGATNPDHMVENLNLGGFVLSSEEMTTLSRIGLSSSYDDTTKIDLKIVNKRDTAVRYYWVNNKGEEILQGFLPQNTLISDAASVSTYHGHKFAFRLVHNNELVKTLTVDAKKGPLQVINVDGKVTTVIENHLDHPIDVFWVDENTGKEMKQGRLNVNGGNPVNSEKVEISTMHGHKFVAKDARGEIISTIQVDAKEGSLQHVIFSRHGRDHQDL